VFFSLETAGNGIPIGLLSPRPTIFESASPKDAQFFKAKKYKKKSKF